MKILVVNLLRMGDIVMTTPMLRGLRRRYPGAKIHFLMNRQFSGLCPLLTCVDEFHFFERDLVQKGLGSPERPMFESFDRINELVDELNALGFDKLINVTQNKMSAWLCSIINAKEKVGLTFSATGEAQFGSNWFRHLNNRSTNQDQFHYSDIYCFAADIVPSADGIHLQTTTTGEAFAARELYGVEDFIVVQALSSDNKKNWPLSRFCQALELFAAQHPNYTILLLAAPAEAEMLQVLHETLSQKNIKSRVLVCDLEGALSVIRRSQMVLTLDTGIKHIAAATTVPIVELCLGSSDYRLTGVYSNRAVVIRSKAPCAPCPHSSPCAKTTHICSDLIPPEVVALTLSEVLRDGYNQLFTIQREFHDSIEILVTRKLETGFWFAAPVDRRLDPWLVEKLIDRSSWKMLLEKEHLKPFGTFAEEGRHIRKILFEMAPGQAGYDWRVPLNQLEGEIVHQEQRLNRVQILAKKILFQMPNTEIEESTISELEAVLAESGVIANMLSTVELSKMHLGQKRRFQELIEDAYHLSQIKLRIIRSIRNQITESI